MIFIEVEHFKLNKKITIRLDKITEFFASAEENTTIICRNNELPMQINEDYESFKNRIANIATIRDNVWQRT